VVVDEAWAVVSKGHLHLGRNSSSMGDTNREECQISSTLTTPLAGIKSYAN